MVSRSLIFSERTCSCGLPSMLVKALGMTGEATQLIENIIAVSSGGGFLGAMLVFDGRRLVANWEGTVVFIVL